MYRMKTWKEILAEVEEARKILKDKADKNDKSDWDFWTFRVDALLWVLGERG